MSILALVFLVCLFIFLFVLYIVSHDDFVLLRKNIFQEQVFNLAFISLACGLFGARLFYVVFHFKASYLNPFVFLLFPYFPGLSLVGGIIGASLFTVLYTAKQKMPTERLLDFFAFPAIYAITTGFVGLAIIDAIHRKIELFRLAIVVLYVFLTILFTFIVLPKQRRGELVDGSLGLLFLLSFSIISFVSDGLSKTSKVILFVGAEGIFAIGLFLISLILLLKREKFIRLRGKPRL